jgi:hypothetical protein
MNNCGYNCEYPNKQSHQIRSQQLFTVAETRTRDNIIKARGASALLKDSNIRINSMQCSTVSRTWARCKELQILFKMNQWVRMKNVTLKTSDVTNLCIGIISIHTILSQQQTIKKCVHN